MSPTTSRVQSSALGIAMALLGGLTARAALRIGTRYDALVLEIPVMETLLREAGAPASLARFAGITSLLAALWILSALAAIAIPGPRTLRALRASCCSVYAIFCYWTLIVLRLTRLPAVLNVEIAGAVPDSVTLFFWRYAWLLPPAIATLVAASLHLLSWKASFMNAFGAPPPPGTLAPADRLLENIRTHGHDPAYRRSLWRSSAIHLTVIFIIPWLLSLRGCIEPYRIPKGSGQPEITVVQVVRAERQKRRFVLNPHSAISFRIPDLDDSEIERDVMHVTQMTYQADPNRVVGALGAGGGTAGGWPDGMDDATARFIRIQYNGLGWDEGMDSVSRSDRNFLDFFRHITGFKTATQSESHPIADLRRYPKGYAPPFVYMTGHGGINISQNDIRILREYLTQGGMLFADCGSPQWHAAFRSLMAAVFPGEPLRVIADDDPIFQFPYAFPNGAPPLWHHGGRQALGIRYRNRWAVFYHPGDVKDAWRTGHSGLAPHLARSASELGVNILYYAFTHYLEQTRRQRR